MQSLEQRPVEKFGAGRSADAFEQQVAQYLVGRADGHRPRGFGRLRRPLLFVDQVAVGDLRPAFDRSVVEPPEHVGFDIIVAVHEHVIIVVCNAHARIAGTALPLIGLVKTDQRRMGSGIMITDLAARVSGSVIDQDDFRIGIALCQ